MLIACVIFFVYCSISVLVFGFLIDGRCLFSSFVYLSISIFFHARLWISFALVVFISYSVRIGRWSDPILSVLATLQDNMRFAVDSVANARSIVVRCPWSSLVIVPISKRSLRFSSTTISTSWSAALCLDRYDRAVQGGWWRLKSPIIICSSPAVSMLFSCGSVVGPSVDDIEIGDGLYTLWMLMMLLFLLLSELISRRIEHRSRLLWVISHCCVFRRLLI